jgi:hypothetical protein
MKHSLKNKLLGVPIIIWVLQLLYVATALGIGILIALLADLNHQSSHLFFQVLYVLIIIAVNIIWRIKIKNSKPEWF